MSAAIAEAVVFFDHNNVVKEMLYPEFEAVLDHVVGIQEYTGKHLKAAYVRINGRLQITAVVLFKIDFDQHGYADSGWNLPLRHLADNAGRGPDLGAGAIKFSCRSQCSVSWHQRSLWDPDLEDNGTLEQLTKAIRQNRLGLLIEEDEQVTTQGCVIVDRDELLAAAGRAQTDVAVTQERVLALENKLRAFKDEYRLRIATLQSKAKKQLEKQQSQHQQQLHALNETLHSTKQLFSDEKRKNLQLKVELEQQAEQFEQLRAQADEPETAAAIQAEIAAKISAATTEFKEMLSMRDVELFYRDEQISRLNNEIAELRKDRQQLLNSGGDQLLQRLAISGVEFVVCPQGLPQTSIAAADISDYLDKPNDYVAVKNGIDPQLYLQWLAHSRGPSCQHLKSDGELCGVPLELVSKPRHFVVGESDRCAKHRQQLLELKSQRMKKEFMV